MLRQYLENIQYTYQEEAAATTFYHEILTAIFLAYPNVKIHPHKDPILGEVESKLSKLTAKEEAKKKLTPGQMAEKPNLEKDLETYKQSYKPAPKTPDNVIEYPSDIIKFINSGGGKEKVFIAATDDLHPISITALQQDRFINSDFDKKNSAELFRVAADALHLANKIRSVIKFKNLQRVYWIGPSNDSTRFGAADIIAVDQGSSKEIYHGISLKFGAGQFKNLSAGTIASLLGIINNPDLSNEKNSDAKFSSQLYTEFEEDWSAMTHEWMSLLIKWSAAKKLKNINKILSSYKNINTYQDYQKQKFTDEEANNFAKELAVFSAENTRPFKADKIKEYSLRYFARKFYEALDTATIKEWGTDTIDESTSKGSRAKYFEKIIGGFFGFGTSAIAKKRKKIIDEKLSNLFLRQVSALPETELWYFAQTGKEYTLIPSQKTIREALEKNLKLRCDASSSGSGYVFPIIVSIDKKDVFAIKIVFRWIQGQMYGMFSTTSTKETEYTDWGTLLRGITTAKK